MESISMLTNPGMKVIGYIISGRGKVCMLLQLATDTMASSHMDKVMATWSSNLIMEEFFKENLLIGLSMVIIAHILKPTAIHIRGHL